MRDRHLFLFVCILILTAGCTWTAPGPTFTPWPTLTPRPNNDPETTSAPAATDTPQAQGPQEEPDSRDGEFPDMPENPAERDQMFQGPPPMIIDPDRLYRATIKTSRGDIECELYAAQATQTVNNFVYLARAGFYAGLTFHRVVPGFIIQGGDPLGKGNGGPGYTIPAEIGLPHLKGAMATARLSDQVNPDRDSSGGQFYITLDKTPHLDGGYTVFGQVIEGMSVVESIVVGDLIQDIVIYEE